MKMGMCCSTDKSRCVSRCIKIAVLAVVGIAALGWVVMLLWNWLLPELFAGVHAINYCQALGVLLLSKILFGSFRCGGHGHWRHHRQQWENMTPEEREQLKSRFGNRWGKWCCASKHEANAPKEPPTHAE